VFANLISPRPCYVPPKKVSVPKTSASLLGYGSNENDDD